MCFGILCWRLPLLVEWLILVPFSVAVHFVPSAHLTMSNKGTKIHEKQQALQLQLQQQEYQPLLHRRRHSLGGPASHHYGALDSTSHPPRRTESPNGPLYSGTLHEEEHPNNAGALEGRSYCHGEVVKAEQQWEGQVGRLRRADEEAAVSSYIDDDGGDGSLLPMSRESPVSALSAVPLSGSSRGVSQRPVSLMCAVPCFGGPAVTRTTRAPIPHSTDMLSSIEATARRMTWRWSSLRGKVCRHYAGIADLMLVRVCRVARDPAQVYVRLSVHSSQR